MSTESPLSVEQLATIIKESAGVGLDPSALATDSSFEDLGVDSLGLLGVVVKLENQYGLTLSTAAEQCQTAGELVEMVNSKLGTAV